jgi:hypothetical protein
MIQIKKQIEIIINGEDVETLKNICELARITVDRAPYLNSEKTISHFDSKQTYQIENFLTKIFDA